MGNAECMLEAGSLRLRKGFDGDVAFHFAHCDSGFTCMCVSRSASGKRIRADRAEMQRTFRIAASCALVLAVVCLFSGLFCPTGAYAFDSAGETSGIQSAQPAHALSSGLVATQSGDAVQSGSVVPDAGNVKVSVRPKGAGWKSATAGATAGTFGKKGLRKLRAKLVNVGVTGSIVYRAYTSKGGWTKKASNGKTLSAGKRNITAIKIALTGDVAKRYDVYYRTYFKGFGWLGWTKNNKQAGTRSTFGHIGAVQVKLVAKGTTFDCDTRVPFVKNRWQAIERKYLDDADVHEILEVKYVGGTKAKVVLRSKGKSKWKTVVSCRGYVGKRGVGKTREGLSRTPSGDFEITEAFGIKSDPGAQLDYVKVDRSMYWCSDRKYYNQLIDINECPHSCSGEHLIDIAPHYNYGLFFDYNTNPVRYGKGSAFFVHCTGGQSYTEGCIAVAPSKIIKIIRNVSDGARICIYKK